MGYEVRCEVAARDRIRPQRGIHPPAANERLEAIASALRDVDASLQIRTVGAGLMAHGDRLGQLDANANRVSIRFPAELNYTRIIQCLRDLLCRLEPLGFLAYDKQVGDTIRYVPDCAEFFHQFRHQIDCSNEEFAQWISGIEPERWRLQREHRDAYRRLYVAQTFPRVDAVPGDAEWALMSNVALAEALKQVARHNDAILARSGLARLLPIFLGTYPGAWQRADGSRIPFEAWLLSTSLGQELNLVNTLQHRGWPAVLFDQPQQVVLETDERDWQVPAGCKASDIARSLSRSLRKAVQASGIGILRHAAWSNSINTYTVETDDANRMLDVLIAALRGLDVMPMKAHVRCGGPGTPVRVVPLA